MTVKMGYTAVLWVCVFAVSAVRSSAQTQAQQADNCRTCHELLTDERLSSPAKRFPSDVHAASGFGCVSCHGGDASTPAGMDPAKGFIGKPDRQQIPALCGRCHSDAEFMKRYDPSLRIDQQAEYVTSVHGQRLIQYSDTSVATCASCHSAHEIRPPSDPNSTVHPLNVAETCGSCHAHTDYMRAYAIPTDQLEKYRRSIHWRIMSEDGDLSAPTCNDCHGNHGAAPPGISWVGNTCGQCHAVMAEFFSRSVHSNIFTMLGVPGCATCHGNHEIAPADDRMLGLDEGAVCARCHVEGVGGGVGAATMRALIDSLKSEFERADSILLTAEHSGMEVSQAQFELGNAQNALVQARTAIHAFDVDSVQQHVAAGLEITAAANDRGQRALKELQFRRAGLVVSVTVIIALIVGLVLKIREIEGRV